MKADVVLEKLRNGTRRITCRLDGRTVGKFQDIGNISTSERELMWVAGCIRRATYDNVNAQIKAWNTKRVMPEGNAFAKFVALESSY